MALSRWSSPVYYHVLTEQTAILLDVLMEDFRRFRGWALNIELMLRALSVSQDNLAMYTSRDRWSLSGTDKSTCILSQYLSMIGWNMRLLRKISPVYHQKSSVGIPLGVSE